MIGLDQIPGLAKAAVDVVRAQVSSEQLATVINLQLATLELVGEVRELRRQVDEANQALRYQGELQFRHNTYWTGPDDALANGPYCTKCWDANRLLVRIHPRHDKFGICPNCDKSIVDLPPTIAPPSQSIRRGPRG